jgi:hypothetical protein
MVAAVGLFARAVSITCGNGNVIFDMLCWGGNRDGVCVAMVMAN